MNLLAYIAERAGHASSSPSMEELGSLLGSIADRKDHILPYVTEPDTYAYGRNVLFRSPAMEYILIHLPARCRTAVHDHGVSAGCAAVIEGVLTNVIYQMDEGCLRREQVCREEPGSFFYSPHGIIHQMVNESDRRVLSLHVYSPPLRDMKVYPQPL